MTPYEKIFLMNTLMGHRGQQPGSPEFWQQVRNQSELVVEEAGETLDECIDENLENLVGEVSDIMVVAIGLYQKLQLSGVDIDKAFDRVCDKNLEKVFEDAEEANETVKFYQDQGVETFVRHTVLEDGSEYYAVIRKADGKMMKPQGFVKATFEDIAEEALNGTSDEE